MRDRLIELIQQADAICSGRRQCEGCTGFGKGADCVDYHIADGLLDNGITVPHCKKGDTVYHICTVFNEATLKCETVIIPRVIDFMTSSTFLAESKRLIFGERDFGTTVFSSREEAEAALKGGE